MIHGGAAMDLAFIRRISPQSFSIFLSLQSSSPLRWVIPVKDRKSRFQPGATRQARSGHWAGAMRMSHSDRSKANLRIAGDQKDWQKV